jgi:hypothetical protein
MTALATLARVAFKTDRLGEFVGRRELTAQIGHPPEEWPLVFLKEALDNALDACEEALAPPEIAVDVSTDPVAITIIDNGPGIAAETVCDILDYAARVSSREAYVSPTRGAQGNALKTLLAMPFALDGDRGTSVIESRGIRHEIIFRVDQLRQRPVIDHRQTHGLLQKRDADPGRLSMLSRRRCRAIFTNRRRLRVAQPASRPDPEMGRRRVDSPCTIECRLEEMARARSDLGPLVRRAAAHPLYRGACRTRPGSPTRPDHPGIHRRVARVFGFGKAKTGSRQDRADPGATVIPVWSRRLTGERTHRGSATGAQGRH